MAKFKTTVVIWSDFDPTATPLENLLWQEARGMVHMSKNTVVEVEDPKTDPDYPGDEFFED